MNTCYKIPPQQKFATTCKHPLNATRKPSSMSMNSQASNKQSDTSMQWQVSQQNGPGYQPSSTTTTAPGNSSMSRMWANIFHNLKKHSKNTWKVSVKAYYPPNSMFTLTYQHQPFKTPWHLHQNLWHKKTQFTQTKPVSCHTSPAEVFNTKWSSTMSTATPSGLNPQKQNRRWTHPSMNPSPPTYESLGYNTTLPSTWQQNFYSIHKRHHHLWHVLSTGTSQWPSTKHRRKRNSNMEGSFCLHTQQYRQQLPSPPMVSTHPTDGAPTQLATSITQ